jgi:hypothetical protein
MNGAGAIDGWMDGCMCVGVCFYHSFEAGRLEKKWGTVEFNPWGRLQWTGHFLFVYRHMLVTKKCTGCC